jgi:hypothetical protein
MPYSAEMERRSFVAGLSDLADELVVLDCAALRKFILASCGLWRVLGGYL